MSIRKIAVGGSAADPPHNGHYAVIKKLIELERFDLVIWILSGFRPDKNLKVIPDDRVAMTELMLDKTWRTKPGTRLVVKYDDVYNKNTPTAKRIHRLEHEYPGAEIVWFTGSDSVIPRPEFGGKCEIEVNWTYGQYLMVHKKFIILNRPGYEIDFGLPENFEVLDVQVPSISSSDIRSRIKFGQEFEHLVHPEVGAYIKRNQLYGWKGELE